MNVRMISKPQLDESAVIDFLDEHGVDIDGALVVSEDLEAESIVETCARLCYMSFGKGRKSAKDFFDNILNSGHFSVLEHANYGFLVTGVSRSLTLELVRHRHFSFSQLSQRFVDAEDMEAVIPPALRDTDMEPLLHSAMNEAKGLYTFIQSRLRSAGFTRKQANEAARAVLPNCTETKIAITGNVRTWREFILKRRSPYADAEIQELAEKVRTMLVAEAPLLMGGME